MRLALRVDVKNSNDKRNGTKLKEKIATFANKNPTIQELI